METPLVDKDYLLKKFEGKGGWTFAEIPEILQDKHAHFGWVKVKGRIDDYEISHYHLMPMGNGKLFLPVKAEIRKKIGKEAGDTVRIVLYEDKSELVIPEELMICLEAEPQAHKKFHSLSQGEQKRYIDWVYEAKKEETQVKRIAQMMNRLLD